MVAGNSRPSTTLVGIAGVHFVVSELSRRGLVALPTIRKIAGYDVVVAAVQGAKHANVQVKTSGKRRHFFGCHAVSAPTYQRRHKEGGCSFDLRK